MRSTVEKGRIAESFALEFLEKKGLHLKERNFRSGHKEIDLIMESDDTLHIIEVKSLGGNSPADPLEKVDNRKRRLIALAAGHYVALHNIEKEVQFDVVSVVQKGTEFELEYLPNAFYPIYH